MDNNQPSFRTRLIAFLLVLAVGFFMGFVNGRGQAAKSTDDVSAAQEQSQQTGSKSSQQTDESASAQLNLQQDEPDTDDQYDAEEQYYDDGDEQAEEAPSQQQDQSDSGYGTASSERGPTTIDEDGWYTSKEEVALYIHTYGRLPGNFISKTKARAAGWVSSKGNLDKVCPGMSIGGSEFYNDDGQLPDAKNRRWTECDIDYHGGYRGAERIVFSNDGLIFYTDDHYKTFEQLY